MTTEARTPTSELKKVRSSDKPTPSLAPNDTQESSETIANRISASRAKGHTITVLLDMHKLMKQWSPIGFTREKLIESLGEPTSSSDKAMIYRFEHSMGGWQWEFDIDQGVVSNVRPVSLE